MNKLLLCVLCVLAFFAAVVPCFADRANGVLAEERVVNLPNDQGKWYISVVGNTNDARYNEIVGWFTSNTSLAKLKNQVHFCLVTTNTTIYKERYAKNVKGLPTVRLQNAQGAVVYEAAGKNLPMTAAGLNGALAGAVNEAQTILPWRRYMERRCPGPNPCPTPGPRPDPGPTPGPDTGPDEAPSIDDGGTPAVEPAQAAMDWLLAPICGAALLFGLCLGYGRKLYKKLVPAVK
jgi:hypothetical protein